MNGVWFPASASVLLRRVVNVIGTLSITHHYLPRSERDTETQGKGEKPWESRCLRDALGWDWTPVSLMLNEPRKMNDVIASCECALAAYCSTHASGTSRGQDIMFQSSLSIFLLATGISIPWPWLRWPTPTLRSSAEHATQPEESPGPHLPPSSNSNPSTPPPTNKQPPMPSPANNGHDNEKSDTLHRLLRNPTLYDPVRTPRYPIVLCHGLYGFDVRGPSAFPSLRMQYWSTILGILRKTIGAEVIVTSVPGTGSIASRSEQLHRLLEKKTPGRGLNFMAHSMGGLDCRHLITHVKPTEYTPLSLTTIATPHRGSPFMDWCTDYLGIGRNLSEKEQTFQAARAALDASDASSSSSSFHSSRSGPESDPKQSSSSSLLSLASLPSSFTTLLLSMFDSPAYANLTTTYLNTVFNPATPDDPSVKYFSVAGRTETMNVWHPLWLPKLVLDGAEDKSRALLRAEASDILGSLQSPTQYLKKTGDKPPASWEDDELWGNDGLVTVQSARWGEFLGTMEGSDHWELRGASGIEMDLDLKRSVRGWNSLDWSRFVRAWKKEEGERQSRESAASSSPSSSSAHSSVFGGPVPRPSPLRLGANIPGLQEEYKQQDGEDVLKSSTEKLSAVFDWIVDQVPSTDILPTKLPSLPLIRASKKTDEERKAEIEEKKREKREKKREAAKGRKKSDLENEKDLERFYVALARKLYDEGL